MRWLAERLILSWGLTCALAAGASAQTEANPQPAASPQAVANPPAVANPAWLIRLGVNEVYESNVRFGASGPIGELGSQLEGTLARGWTGPRGGVSISGNASQFLYRRLPDLNQFMYGVAGSASYAVTPRVTWDVGDSLSSRYAQDVTAISDAGLLPPKLLTRINDASTGLRYTLTPRTQIRWGVSEQQVSFESSQFTGASTLATNVNITRQLTRSQTFGVTADYQRTVVNGTIATIQGLLGTWKLAAGKDVSVTGAAGIRPYTLPDQAGFRIAPAGSIGFNTHLRSNDTISLHYERSIEQALGIGTHLTQGVAANYGLSLGSRVTIEAGGIYGRGTYPLDPGHLLTGRTASISGRFLLVQNLALAFGSSVYVRTDTPRAPISDYRTAMSLTYGRSWR